MNFMSNTERVIPSRRNPGGVKRGEESRAVERVAHNRTGSFAVSDPSGVFAAQDDTVERAH